MAIPNIGEGMGKKIVEALKMQSTHESEELVQENIEENSTVATMDTVENIEDKSLETFSDFNKDNIMSIPSEPIYAPSQNNFSQSFIDNAFQQSVEQNISSSNYNNMVVNVDVPANVAILKQLIAKLPSGVSKQTGAVIIKQTMEALGISMNSVLQEAKQSRDGLVIQVKECQDNIVEYHKQIALMEAKSQQYQKESAMLNDIINLFLQTGIR